MPVSCSLYRSRELVSNTPSTHVDYIRDAAANGFERVYHYNAIPEGVKGIEPHIALCSSAGSEDAPSKLGNESSSAEVTSPSPEAAKNTSQSDGTSGLPVTTNEGDGKPQSRPSPIARDHNIIIHSTPEWKSPLSNVTLGRAEDMISWTDDNVDATDYKNMIDYDPNQDESIYDSTTDFDTEATASPPKRGSRVHSGEVPAPLPSGLLLLLITGPLNPLPLPFSSSPNSPTTPTKHANFLAHFARYPYLTSHENYILHRGYVLFLGDADAPAQYLIVQESSDLDLTRRGRKVGLNWELKRQEAKHWWRKEERGARGVRVGFFKLGDVEEVDKTSHQ